MGTQLYLGIDLGTSSIKASVADIKGQIIDSETYKYDTIKPYKNWSEQNPSTWYNGLLIILNVLRERINFKNISALSFCGQMHGLVTLDKNDNVIRNAILWNDSRVTEEVKFLDKDENRKLLLQETGNIALCGFTLPKLMWMKVNEPELYAKISKIMLPKDYLVYKISGIFASDITDLSGTLFFNCKENTYSEHILEKFDINKSWLPSIHYSYDVIGTVSKEFSLISGLNETTKVIVGGGDQAVGAIGTNTLNDQTAFISLGTSGVVFSPIKKYSFDNEGKVHSFSHFNGNHFLMGVTLNASGALKWWMEDVLNIKDYKKELSKLDNEPTNIVFLPYLSGERSPINDPDAKGLFFNLNNFYKRKDLNKAVIQGISFSLYDNYLVMKKLGIHPKYLRVIGGGSKSKVFVQMLSNIFNKEIRTISTSDGGTLGAIILALVGDGVYKDVRVAANELIKDKDIYYPNIDLHNKYKSIYKKYKTLYKATKSL